MKHLWLNITVRYGTFTQFETGPPLIESYRRVLVRRLRLKPIGQLLWKHPPCCWPHAPDSDFPSPLGRIPRLLFAPRCLGQRAAIWVHQLPLLQAVPPLELMLLLTQLLLGSSVHSTRQVTAPGPLSQLLHLFRWVSHIPFMTKKQKTRPGGFSNVSFSFSSFI